MKIEQWREIHCEWTPYKPTPDEEQEEKQALEEWRAQRGMGREAASTEAEKSDAEKEQEAGAEEEELGKATGLEGTAEEDVREEDEVLESGVEGGAEGVTEESAGADAAGLGVEESGIRGGVEK